MVQSLDFVIETLEIEADIWQPVCNKMIAKSKRSKYNDTIDR